jgi:hypothetical protein
MFCCKDTVALHEPDIIWRAECLTKRVEMPLMNYYRHLSFILSVEASSIRLYVATCISNY